MSSFPEPIEDSQSLEILARIQVGDESGWDQLFALYHDELLFVARMELGSRLRAFLESEDIFQSVAADAIRTLGRFEHRGEGSLRRHLHRMVLNKIRDRADTVAARKRSGGVPLTDSLEARLGKEEGPPRYLAGDRYERLESALARLPEEQRQILLLRKVQGLSSKEAAEQLGKSDAAVRKLFSRALARLSSMFGEGGGAA